MRKLKILELFYITLIIFFFQKFAYSLEIKKIYQTKKYQKGAAEILVYNKFKHDLLVANSFDNSLDVYNLNNSGDLIKIDKKIGLYKYGYSVNSVAINNSGLIALAISRKNKSKKGRVVFLDQNYQIVKSIKVGFHPDMVKFTNSGDILLVANEGEPAKNNQINPPGSISIITINNLKKSKEIFFKINQLKNSNLTLNLPTPNDFEPEYIDVSDDDKFAFISLQENNAIAIINLKNFDTSIFSLGLKDYLNNDFKIDLKNDGKINMLNLPIKAMYQPDAILYYEIKKNFTKERYLITANEGSHFENFSDIDNLKNLNINKNFKEKYKKFLDEYNNLYVSNQILSKNLNQVIDNPVIFGSRSFSIFEFDENNESLKIIYDSKDDFEKNLLKYDKQKFNSIFNFDTNEIEFDTTSELSGIEPQSLLKFKVEDKNYLAILIQKLNGMFIYQFNESNKPIFVKYINNSDTLIGPEGIIFLSKELNKLNKNLIIVCFSDTGNLALYEVK